MNITRRDVLKAGAAATALSLMPTIPAHSMPKKGGRLRLGLDGSNTSDSWDSRTHSDIFMILSGHGTVFDCLTEIAADGQLTGELAESWDSDDAKTWVFNLRKGVTFHNGKSFGADDVIESLQLHVAEGAKSAAQPIVSNISEMKKMNEHQVQLVLDKGNADFPFLMSDYHICMFPAGQIPEAMANGIGTGLYAVQSFDPGVRLVTKRYADHYKGDGVGHFDEVEVIAINDTAARMNALMTGQVDAVNRVDFNTEPLLRANPNLGIFEVTGNQHYTFPMLSKTAPFHDNNVRQALKHAINRQEMVDKILQGHGQVGNDHPIGPANQYHFSDLPQTEYDPDKARSLLSKAGLSELNVDLSASNAGFPGAVDAAQLYQASAKAAGININVVQEPADGYWSNVWLKKPWCACYWSGRTTEDWMFSTAYEAGVPWNDSEWDHPRFQELLYKGRVELDSDKRRAIYHEMQMILNQEGGVIVPMFASYVGASSTGLANNGTIGNTWMMDNARMAERWWFA
ncbi:MAG: ABC transporter substrate-binding protein [Gammaproteobacteria bacterium]|nr:ABC transporter substrate-binding protein [Gammaproteobacteria bacterium]MYD75493.1 ABC transporter substrate-binding protein [Gammaproteobacteria bacterium]MYJ51296.1 ABC transporter substrate-binding protein [Gammaproteobacteria bacterium]